MSRDAVSINNSSGSGAGGGLPSDLGVAGEDSRVTRRRQRVIAAANACETERLKVEIRNLETEAKFFCVKIDRWMKGLKLKDAKMQALLRESATSKATMGAKKNSIAGGGGTGGGSARGERKRSAGGTQPKQSGGGSKAGGKEAQEGGEELIRSLQKIITIAMEHQADDNDDDDDEDEDDEDDNKGGTWKARGGGGTSRAPSAYVNPPTVDGLEAGQGLPGQNVRRTGSAIVSKSPNGGMASIKIIPPTPPSGTSPRESATVRRSRSAVKSASAPPPLPPPAGPLLGRNQLRAAIAKIYASSIQEQPPPPQQQQQQQQLQQQQQQEQQPMINQSDDSTVHQSSAEERVERIVKRLHPIVKRSPLNIVQQAPTTPRPPVGRVGSAVPGSAAHPPSPPTADPNDEHYQMTVLKQILSSQFHTDTSTMLQPQIDEKAAQRARNRDKKLWNKLRAMPIVLPPIHQHKKIKFTTRYWDFDTPTRKSHGTAPIRDEEWEELEYCRYLRPPLAKFRSQSVQHA